MSDFDPKSKYMPFDTINLKERKWPNQIIEKAPTWCSVDLRDGNQSLIEPMDTAKKLKLFNTLISMGFKEIEIGFPSASETDYNFCRHLIENNLIPKTVTIQVLTQAREHLIDKTFESLEGCHSAIIHLYNSVSTLQRKVVFKQDRQGVKNIALDGAKMIFQRLEELENTNIRLR